MDSAIGFRGCDTMAKRQYDEESATVPHEGPMVATFWRQGKFLRVPCLDVSVAITPYYAEIILRGGQAGEEQLLFVVSDDPDIEANMTTNGQCAAYDGFLLKDHDGSVIEQITTRDCKTVH